jgi:uncharacterized integral membrane protein
MSDHYGAEETPGNDESPQHEQQQQQLSDQDDDAQTLRSSQLRESVAFRTEESLGGLLASGGMDVRKQHLVDGDKDHPDMGADATSRAARQLRRKGAWRGVELSADAVISFAHAEKTFDFKIRSLELGSELRTYFVFLVMFLIFFLVERDVSANFYFAESFKGPLLGSEIAKLKVAKFFADIQEASDFNNWIVDVFLIQSIDPAYPTGGQYFVGAFRLRTQRVRKDSCEINNAIIPNTMPDSALECYGDWSDENAEDGTADNAYNQVGRWKYRTCDDLGGGTVITGQMARYNCGGYFFEVPWWRPTTEPAASNTAPLPSTLYERMPKDVVEKLYVVPALYNNPPFVDDLATRFAVVEFFAYQPTVGNFFSFKLFAEEAAGGLWYTDYQSRVFDIWTAGPLNITKAVYDFFFLIFVLYYLCRFVGDLVNFYRAEGGRILGFFFDTWNLLELANVSIFLVVFGFRIAWIIKSLETNQNVEELIYQQRYPLELDDLLNLYMFQIYLNSVNTVLSFLKLLKYFRLNSRLNVLTRTLGESQDSIIGVLLIFFLVVTAFAMTGHGLFGLGVWAFRSVDSSYSTLLLMLVGQFDYRAMKNENRVLAGFFFWAYIILGLFCLLNFLIGVLMEAFAEVSKSRTVLPLESVLVKTWEDLKRLCNVDNIKRTCAASCRGETRAELLRAALNLLKVHREERARRASPGESAELLRKNGPLHAMPTATTKMPASFMAILESTEEGREVVDKIGQAYLDYVWNDLVYEWDQSEGAQEAIDAQRNLAMTARGVHQSIGQEMKILESLPDRLEALEEKLGNIAKILGQNVDSTA